MKWIATIASAAALLFTAVVPAAAGGNGELDPWAQHLIARNAYVASLATSAKDESDALDPWMLHLIARSTYAMSLGE
jgi:hypothetical protein